MIKADWLSRLRILAVAAVVLAVVAVGGSGASAAPGGGGSVSGVVVDAIGNPLAGICVNVDGGSGSSTDGAGRYVVGGVAAGSYRVEFSDCTAIPVYVTQWYLNHPDPSSADLVTIVDGVDTPLAAVVMQAGVTVAGTVTDGNNVPIGGINVNVNPRGAGQSAGVQTDAFGMYVTAPLPSGDYRVQFSDSNPTPMWATQFWNAQVSWNNATVLTLHSADGSSRGGIDAQLSVAADLSGTVRGPDGSGVGGICVSATVPTNGGYDQVGSATSAVDGTYTIGALPATGVKVDFRDCNVAPVYVESWYGPDGTFPGATTILLNPGDHRGGVDQQLSQGITINGTYQSSPRPAPT